MNNHDFCIKHAAHIASGMPCPSKYGRARSGAHINCTGSILESYGSHYPLLYAIERENGTRVLVINRTGYGQATSKHIGHAFSGAISSGVDYVSVRSSGIPRTREGVLIERGGEAARLRRTYDALKRKNTKKAAAILADIERVKADIKTITG